MSTVIEIASRPGSVVTTARLNMRAGRPTRSAAIVRKVDVGERLTVQTLVRGEVVSGNDEWYAGDGDTYFWSGAVGSWEPAASAASLDVPRRPNGTIRPLDTATVRHVFGDITARELEGGRVELDPAWVAANIVELPTAGWPQLGSSLRVHRLALASFSAALASIAARGLASRILTCAGTFVPRHIGWDRARPLSPHSWGIAIDINVAWNGYGREPAPLGAVGSVRELVPLFEAQGFAWGGYFRPDPIIDGMHFELARRDL